MGGMILAVSAAPASAQEVQPVGWTGPMGFTVKTARHLELCKNNKKFHKRYKDQVYKKEQRQKKYTKGSAIGIDIRKKLQASRGVRRYMGNDSAVKPMDCHA